MKSILAHPDSHLEITQMTTPTINDDEALLQTKACGVCGTDILKLNLRLLKTPTVLGHEYVGVIQKLGKNVKNFSVGDTIVAAHHVPCGECHFCRHNQFTMCEHFKKTNFVPGGFSEFIKLSGEHLNHTTFKIPKDMPWQEALFTEPLACTVRNVNRLPLLKNDVVIVMGLGSMGLMTTALLQHRGITVMGVDLDEARCNTARDFGATEVFTSTTTDFETHIKAFTENRGADGIIFTAGPATLLPQSLDWIRSGGFVNLFSHLSGELTPLDTANLYHRELQIITTYSASPDSLKEAFTLLASDALKLRRMLGPNYAPENFTEALDDINKRKVLKAVVVF